MDWAGGHNLGRCPLDVSITGTLVDRVRIDIRPAPPALRPYVGCFWIMVAEPRARLRVVPDGYATVAVDLVAGRPPCWTLSGPLLEPRERRFVQQTTLAGVRLRPGVPYLLTRTSVESSVGRRVTLTNAPWARALVGDRSAKSAPTFIDSLEAFLMERLGGEELDPTVAAAIEAIRRTQGRAPVRAVAAECRVSTRHLARLMRIWTGLGPKSFARIVRFQSTLEEIAQPPASQLAELAVSGGFFDQSHLNREVSRFTGTTPLTIVRTAVSEFSKTRC